MQHVCVNYFRSGTFEIGILEPLFVIGVFVILFSLNHLFLFGGLQPGPRDVLLKCFIKRNRSTQTYFLFLSLTNGEQFLP